MKKLLYQLVMLTICTFILTGCTNPSEQLNPTVPPMSVFNSAKLILKSTHNQNIGLSAVWGGLKQPKRCLAARNAGVPGPQHGGATPTDQVPPTHVLPIMAS